MRDRFGKIVIRFIPRRSRVRIPRRPLIYHATLAPTELLMIELEYGRPRIFDSCAQVAQLAALHTCQTIHRFGEYPGSQNPGNEKRGPGPANNHVSIDLFDRIARPYQEIVLKHLSARDPSVRDLELLRDFLKAARQRSVCSLALCIRAGFAACIPAQRLQAVWRSPLGCD